MDRKLLKTARYLRSITIKIARVQNSLVDVGFRNTFVGGKILRASEISGWEGEVDYPRMEKEFAKIAQEYGFDTDEEKLSLFIYLLTGGIINNRTLGEWATKTNPRSLEEEIVKDYVPKFNEPKLAGKKWISFFRDKKMMEKRKEKIPVKKIATEFGWKEDDANTISQILNRYRKRLLDID